MTPPLSQGFSQKR